MVVPALSVPPPAATVIAFAMLVALDKVTSCPPFSVTPAVPRAVVWPTIRLPPFASTVPEIVLAALRVAVPPVIVTLPVIAVAALSCASPPVTETPPPDTVSGPLLTNVPPPTATPWATETALLVVNVPAADFVSVPPTEMALPESVTAPAALPAETLPALIAAAVPESTATVAAESKATLSPMMNSMLGPLPFCCQSAEVVFQVPLGPPFQVRSKGPPAACTCRAFVVLVNV